MVKKLIKTGKLSLNHMNIESYHCFALFPLFFVTLTLFCPGAAGLGAGDFWPRYLRISKEVMVTTIEDELKTCVIDFE